MTRIFVTGGSGFVGAHVVRAFAQKGWDVTVFGPSPEPCLSKTDLETINFVPGNIVEKNSLAQAVSDTQPDLVVGLAAYGGSGAGLLASAAADETSALAVNVQGFHSLLATCTELVRPPKVIWASTFAVFGNSSVYPEGIAEETSLRKPESFYGLTKVLAEDLATYFRETHKLNITGIRLPLVFGPGLWYNGVANQIRELFQIAVDNVPNELELTTEPIELMYVKDVAKAFLHTATFDGPLDSIYNLTAFASSPASIAETIRSLLPLTQFKVKQITSGESYSLVNGNKLRREIGFSPDFDLSQACRDYIKELTNAAK